MEKSNPYHSSIYPKFTNLISMKKVLFCCFLGLLFTGNLLAQAPQEMNYQAVLRKANGDIMSSESVTLKLSLLKGSPAGAPVYTETHTTQTNAYGLINLGIGSGISSDTFQTINWSNGPYYLQLNVDGTDMGTTPLLSVPYAFYAQEAGNGFSGDYNDLTNKPDSTEVDPIFSSKAAAQITDAGSRMVITTEERNKLNAAITATGPFQQGNLLSYDGNNWVAADLVTGNTGGGQPFNNIQPYGVVNYCIALQGVFPSRSGLEPFLAEIMLFGGNFAPRGYAFCDGQLLSIAQNSALFSLLGTNYGGDGRTTFGLPDLRGRVPIHAGNGPGLSDYRLGQEGGSETTTLTIQQLPSHNHPIQKKN